MVIVAVLLTAASRATLGEHFLTDVVGAVSGTVGVGVLVAMGLGMLPAGRGGDEPPPVGVSS